VKLHAFIGVHTPVKGLAALQGPEVAMTSELKVKANESHCLRNIAVLPVRPANIANSDVSMGERSNETLWPCTAGLPVFPWMG